MNSSVLAVLLMLFAATFDSFDAKPRGSGSILPRYHGDCIEFNSWLRPRRYEDNAIKYGYNHGYRTTLTALSSGISYPPAHKQAMIKAGSVYIAQSMHTEVYANGMMLRAESVEKYVICSGHILWNPKTNKATYTTPLTDASVNGITVPLYKPNVSSSGLVSYRYYMCPSNLIDNSLDEKDTYCCGPPGYQMCCSREDFLGQLGITDCYTPLGTILSFGLVVPACFVIVVIVGIVIFLMGYFLYFWTCRTNDAEEFQLQGSDRAIGHGRAEGSRQFGQAES